MGNISMEAPEDEVKDEDFIAFGGGLPDGGIGKDEGGNVEGDNAIISSTVSLLSNFILRLPFPAAAVESVASKSRFDEELDLVLKYSPHSLEGPRVPESFGVSRSTIDPNSSTHGALLIGSLLLSP
jgi:hypothetical protein